VPPAVTVTGLVTCQPDGPGASAAVYRHSAHDNNCEWCADSAEVCHQQHPASFIRARSHVIGMSAPAAMLSKSICGFEANVEKHFVDKIPASCVDDAVDVLTPVEFVVLLYYSYVEINDIQEAIRWHEKVAKHTGLKGRIRISPEGLNVVLDGLKHNIDLFIDAVK
jgi:hypothetical protein